jgi:preprotein translocase subunit SecB
MNDKTKISKFQFKGFKIINSSIEIQEQKDIGETFNLSFNPSGKLLKKEHIFRLYLETVIKDDFNALKINVVAVADYHFKNDIDKQTLKNLFFINASAILFPYIRAYISSLTSLSGVKPITLPTMNLQALGNKLEANTKEVES